MKEIPLTKGKVALVDDDIFEELSKHKWYTWDSNGSFYAVRAGPKVKGKQNQIQMHRVIMHTPNGMDTDHVNGDGLDNRCCNLRVCTRTENQRNQHRKREGCSSEFKGVHWRPDTKKWRASITVNKKVMPQGAFENEVHAALAYDEAAKKYFGEFAYTNFKDV